MTDQRKNVAAHVAEKTQNMAKQLTESTSDEDKFGVYDTYGTYLGGLKKGLEIAEAGEDAIKPVTAAISYIEAGQALLEQLGDEEG